MAQPTKITVMQTRSISPLEFNYHDDQWWKGRQAVILAELQNPQGHSLKAGDRVTIVTKKAYRDQNDMVHQNGFVVQSPPGPDFFSVPISMLSLVEGGKSN